MAALPLLVLGSISMGMRDRNGEAFFSKSGGIRPRVRNTSPVQVHAVDAVKLKQLKEYWKGQDGGLWRWRMHCKERQLGDKEWTEAEVDEFFRSGALKDVALPSDELMNRFNSSDCPSIKWLWYKYTNEEGYRIGDPRQVPHSVVEEFLDNYIQKASESDKTMASAETVKRLKSLRSHADYEQLCAEKAFGTRNPALYPAYVASSILSALEGNPK